MAFKNVLVSSLSNNLEIKKENNVSNTNTNNDSKILTYPEADLIVGEVNLRFKRKRMGTNLFVIGLSGTGKSSVSQRLGELIIKSRDDKFKLYIVDSLLTFIQAVRNSVEGDVIVIEEVSVLFPSRRAMGGDNVSIGAIFDTIRKKRLCLISNAPIWNSVDGHMRALGNILIETLAIHKQLEIVISKFHRLQTNPRSGKTYFHTFNREGRDTLMMYTKMPNKEQWIEYEKQKDAFMDELYTKLEAKHLMKVNKENMDLGLVKFQKGRKPLTQKQENVMKLLANCPVAKYKDDWVAEQLNISSGNVRTYKKLAENKSYCVEEFNEELKKQTLDALNAEIAT